MTYSISPLFCRPWTLNGIQPTPGKVQAFVAYLQGHFGPRWWETSQLGSSQLGSEVNWGQSPIKYR